MTVGGGRARGTEETRTEGAAHCLVAQVRIGREQLRGEGRPGCVRGVLAGVIVQANVRPVACREARARVRREALSRHVARIAPEQPERLGSDRVRVLEEHTAGGVLTRIVPRARTQPSEEDRRLRRWVLFELRDLAVLLSEEAASFGMGQCVLYIFRDCGY